MKLCRAEFISIRGVPDVTWNLARTAQATPVDVGVVTGGPSSGKTRLLEAILAAKEVIAPYGLPVDGRPWLRPGETAAKIELTFLLDEDEQLRAGGISAMAHTEALFSPTGCRAEVDDAFASVLDRYEHAPGSAKSITSRPTGVSRLRGPCTGSRTSSSGSTGSPAIRVNTASFPGCCASST